MRPQITCVTCYSGHRKCDLKRPMCGRCKKLGIKCYYNPRLNIQLAYEPRVNTKLTKSTKTGPPSKSKNKKNSCIVTVEQGINAICNVYNIPTKMAYSICREHIYILFIFYLQIYHVIKVLLAVGLSARHCSTFIINIITWHAAAFWLSWITLL